MGNQPDRKLGSEYVYDALVDAGVTELIGLPGTQTLPLDRTIAERDDITYLMARHETAIPHIAWGYYESGGGIAATLTVPGPGDTNAAHGLKNALDDGVPLIHISPDTTKATIKNTRYTKSSPKRSTTSSRKTSYSRIQNGSGKR